MENIKIKFFGDGELSAENPIIYFPKNKVICNFSECGLYITSKYITIEKPKYTNLKRIVKLLSKIYNADNVELYADNNGIAKFFEKNNIKTLKDLISYFSKILNCKYP
jgi:hypothetical protein